MTDAITLDIVSAEKSLYTGTVTNVIATGSEGELGIKPGHTALLTGLKPGQIIAMDTDGREQSFYISGGMLEVQPKKVTVLADTAERAEDLDEAQALEAKKRAEAMLNDKQSDMDYSKAAVALAEAVAQIQAIKKLRKNPH
ncbi:MAG: ATP synthase epsilon chain [marine bacterium B5-7]|nr:MAG: ATP synthase epsilon chain [marine bacterium B5-7]